MSESSVSTYWCDVSFAQADKFQVRVKKGCATQCNFKKKSFCKISFVVLLLVVSVLLVSTVAEL